MTSLTKGEGYIEIDHRASPGIPRDVAERLGIKPEYVAEGAHFEAATITCKHCGGAWIKNAMRIRPRGYCKQCDHYICDGCDARRADPDYVHRCKEEILDNVLTANAQGKVFDESAQKPLSLIVL